MFVRELINKQAQRVLHTCGFSPVKACMQLLVILVRFSYRQVATYFLCSQRNYSCSVSEMHTFAMHVYYNSVMPKLLLS